MVVTVDLLGLGPAMVGFIIGIGGIGAALGAALAPGMRRRFGIGGALVLAYAVGKAFDVLVPLSLLFPALAVPLLIVAQLAGDAFLVVFIVLALSLRQQCIADGLLGRVNATFHLFEGGAVVAGALAAGALTLILPVSVVIWGAALMGALAIPVLWPLRTYREPST